MTNTKHAARVFFATTSLAALALVASACVAGSGESQDGPVAEQAAASEAVEAVVDVVECKARDPFASSEKPSCGNGKCQKCAGESCVTCPEDCGACPVECGDGACEGDERNDDSGDYCPEDCRRGDLDAPDRPSLPAPPPLPSLGN